MKNESSTMDFYFKAIKGRPSAEVFHGMFCVYALLQRKLDHYFKPFDLTAVQFNTLMLVKYLGGGAGLSQKDICRHLIVTPSNITRLIQRMTRAGYLRKYPDPVDKRVHLVRLTAKGEHILTETFHGFGETIQQSVYQLDRPEVETLSALLFKWFTKLEKEKEEAHG